MPSLYEKCSCGSEIDARDAHYEQCKWLVKQWRNEHKHEHFLSNSTDHYAIDSSRNDSVPTGFTREERGITVRPSEIDPDGGDENRKRRR